jgi:hypothetical protein
VRAGLEGADERRSGSTRVTPPARVPRTIPQTMRERIAQLEQRSAPCGVGIERLIDSPPELARQIAAIALQRRQRLADAAGSGGRGGTAHRVDAAERLVEDQR